MFPLRRDQTPLKFSKPKLKQTHTQFAMHGMGDYYGRASKNPMGKIRDASETVGFRPVTKRQLGTKPRSVV
jgi:hypothetical protein